MQLKYLLATGAVAAVAIAAPASALVASPTVTLKAAGQDGSNGSDNGIHDKRGTDVRQCDEDRTITYEGPISIWPPNHKMRNYTITARDANGGNVSLATIVTSSQVANGTGDGNTDVDFVDNTPAGADMGSDGTAVNSGQVRGERSGNDKSGRTYTFDSTATWSDGSTCRQVFTAHVPHDQGKRSGKSGKRSKSAKRSARAAR